jgi:hypothetical protein
LRLAGVPLDRIAYVTGQGPLRKDEPGAKGQEQQQEPHARVPAAAGAPQPTTSVPLSEAEIVGVLSRYLEAPPGGSRMSIKVQPVSQQPIPWAGT